MPEIAALAAQDMPRLAITEILKTSTTHAKHFKLFKAFVAELSAQFKLPVYACSMEVGMSDDTAHPCAVHLVFWMTSASPLEGGWHDTPAKGSVLRSELKFSDVAPQFANVVPWRKSERKGMMLAQRGLYYLLCRKIGSVFSAGTHLPFKDSGV